MPFISIQSIFKKVTTVISEIFERLVTSEIYDVANSSTGLGRPTLSADGTWMCVSTGAYNYGSSEVPNVKVYKRLTGPGTDWQFIQDIKLPGMSDYDKSIMSWGVYGAEMSKDASRIAVMYYDVNATNEVKIAVFSRSGDVWSLEDTLSQSTKPVYAHHSVTFNTTTGIDAANDYITTDDVHEFLFATPVVYFKDGGTANVGLVDVTVDDAETYYPRPVRAYYANTAIIYAILNGQDETSYNNIGNNGTFNGGTGHAIGNVITLSNGATVLVENVSLGVVTEFTVTKGSTSSTIGNSTYSQTSTTGSGINFSLTPRINNMAKNLYTIASHPFVTGDPVRFYTWNGGADIIYKNLVEVLNVYYVRSHSASVLSLYPTLIDANNDTNRMELSYWLSATGLSIINAGTGYTVGDVLQLVGGTYDAPAYARVYSVGGSGNITAIYVLEIGGKYDSDSLPDRILIQGQSQTSYNNSPTTEGTFSGGSGYTAGNVLTLSNGSTVTVNTVSGGVVTGFTVTTASTTATLVNVTLTSTGGTGTGFTLTPDEANLRYYTTSSGGTGTGATFSPSFTTTWTTGGQPHALTHAKKFQLYPTQLDAQNQTNRMQLTSTGGETHRLAISLGVSTSLHFGTSLKINDDGSRILSPEMVGYNRTATATIYDRVGTSWSESANVDIVSPNTYDLTDPTIWSPSYSGFYLRTIDGLAISGDGDTFVVNGTTDGTSFGLQDMTSIFTMVASNPLYGNATTLEISPLLEYTWGRGVTAGRFFELDTYPNYALPYYGSWQIVSVESPTLLVIEPIIDNGAYITPTPTDFTDQYMTLRWEDDFALVYNWNGTSWSLQQALSSPEGTNESDDFGEGGAGLSYNGDVLAVADPYGPWSGDDQGRVYVYERNAGEWTYTQTLAPGASWISRMGSSVEVSPTGNEILAGAPWYGPTIDSTDTAGHVVNPEGYVDYWPRPPFQVSSSSGQNYATGKALLFTRPNSASAYTLEDSYHPFGGHHGYGGDFVSMNSDATVIAVGFPDTLNYEGTGTIYGATSGSIAVWERISYIPAPPITRYYADFVFPGAPPEDFLPADTAGSTNFGYIHKVSKDGSTLVTKRDGSNDIFVYTANWAGSVLSWVDGPILTPSGVTSVKSLDINANGTKIVASCDTVTGQSVVTFVYTGSWTEYSQNNPVDTTFGNTSVMSSDGTTLAIHGTKPNYFASFNTGTDVNGTTDVITTSSVHDFGYGGTIEVATYSREGGSVNIGLTNGIEYWIRRVSPTQFSVHTSLSNANNNIKVNLTATGAETHRFTRQANRDYAFVYGWNSGTNQWVLETDALYEQQISYRNYGKSMAISGDGNTLALITEWQSTGFTQSTANTSGSRGRSLFEYHRTAPPTFIPEWVTVLQAGTGYTLNDILTITSGTPTTSPATIRVTGVGGSGEITSAIIETPNTYTSVTDSLENVTISGGTGNSADLRVWWNGVRYVIDWDQTPVITSPGSGYNNTYDGLNLEGGTPEIISYAVNINTVDGLGGLTGIDVVKQTPDECVYTSIPDPNIGHPVVGPPFRNPGVGGEVKVFWRLAKDQYTETGLWKKVRYTAPDEFWQPSGVTAGITNSENTIAISDDGSVIAIGDNLTNFVYVYERNASTQGARVIRQVLIRDLAEDSQAGTTEPSVRTDAGFGDRKGVYVSPDGNNIIVGAWKFQGAYVEQGKAFVYKKENGQWRKKSSMSSEVCSTATGYDGSSLPNYSQSGSSVSANNDASIITISAPGCDTIFTFTTVNPGVSPGCPVMPTLGGVTDSYTLQTTINPTQSVAQQRIGNDVATDATGNRMVVGGAETRVFVRFADEWILEQELIPTEYLAFQDRVDFGYGHSVDINADGSVVVVGQPSAENTYSGVGRAYVFTRTGSTWAQTATFNPIGFDGGNVGFGTDVSINPAGNVITVSADDRFAWGLDGRCAQAHVFRNVAGTWNGIRVNPVAIDANYLSGSIDYVDNGTNKGIMVVGVRTSEGIDTVTKFFFYEHVYGTPDTLTLTYTYISDPGDWQGTKKGLLQFSPDKGKYLIAGDPNYDPANTYETVGRALIFKNTATVGSDTDPAGPWSLVSQITPPNIGRLPITLANNFVYPWIEFGVGVKISTNGERVLISSSNFTYPDVVSDYNCQLFWGGSAWVLEKGAGESWTPMGDRRLFPRNSNGEFLSGSDDQIDHTTGAIDCTDDMNIIILGGARYMQATTVSADPDLTWVGQARIYVHTPASTKPLRTYTNVAMLEDYDTSLEGNYYGEGPQALSNDGNTIAVTYAYGASDDIDIYVKTAGVWTWQTTLTVANKSPTTGGIQRIKISDDGNKIVCAHDAREFTTFTRSAGVWTEQTLLIATGGIGSNFYPYDYALSGDGNNLFITIYDYAGSPAPTIVKVHTWNAGSWVVQDDTSISGAAVLDENYGGSAMDFGNGLACSYDGNWLVVTGVRYVKAVDGAGWYESPCGYVFHRVGTTWSLHSITPAFWYAQGTNNVRNWEGRAAMTPEGTRFAIGNGGLNRTWVFSRDTNTDRHWRLDAILTYEDPTNPLSEGNSQQSYYWGLGIANDGKQVWSAQYNAPYSRGVLWTYTDDVWRVEEILSNPTDPMNGSYFAYASCISGDGSTITASDNYNVNADGVLWVFEREPEADEMQPFPFATYAVNNNDLVDGALGPPWSIGHYYDDPTLDGVQLNVRICGDGWEDTVNDVFFGVGIMDNTFTGVPEVYGLVWDGVNAFMSSGLGIESANDVKYLGSSYIYGADNFGGPTPQGTYVYPGVAASCSSYGGTNWNEVPCYGKPLSLELWYSDNETKTNQNVKYSGYTHFDSESTGQQLPILYPIVPGYVRRAVAGIIKKDADLSTLSAGDVVAGYIFNGTPSGGELYLIINGEVIMSGQATSKPHSVVGWYSAYMNEPPATFEQYAQLLSYMQVIVYDDLYNDAINLDTTTIDPFAFYPLDTYNVKWAWYYDFVPDAGIGTYCGQIESLLMDTATHPGWPI